MNFKLLASIDAEDSIRVLYEFDSNVQSSRFKNPPLCFIILSDEDDACLEFLNVMFLSDSSTLPTLKTFPLDETTTLSSPAIVKS